MGIELTTTNRLAARKWLGQGKKINAKTIQEVLEQSGMDWTVSKRPIITTSVEPKIIFRDKEDKTKGVFNPTLLDSNGTQKIMSLRYYLKHLLRNINDSNILKKVQQILKETENSYIKLKGHFSIVRNDTNVSFGVLGKIYECIDNRTCIAMLKPLIDSGKAVIERGGTFNDGANCWIIAKLPGVVNIGPETLDEYVKLSWSHNGTEKLSATFICHQNKNNIQFSPKISGSKVSIEIRHTTNAKKRIEIATDLFNRGNIYFKRVEEVMGELVCVAWSENDMEKYLKALIPDSKEIRPDKHGEVKETQKSKTRSIILDIFKLDPSTVSHTKYSAYTSVVEYYDHKKTFKIPNKKKKGESDEQIEEMKMENRLMNLWMKSGSGKKMKDKAMEIIIQ